MLIFQFTEKSIELAQRAIGKKGELRKIQPADPWLL